MAYLTPFEVHIIEALGEEICLEVCSTAADTVIGVCEAFLPPPTDFVPVFTTDDAAAALLPSSSSLPELSDAAPPSSLHHPLSHSYAAASPQLTPAEDSAAGPLPAFSLQSGADLIFSEAPALLPMPEDDTSDSIPASSDAACTEDAYIFSTTTSSSDPSIMLTSSSLLDDTPEASTSCSSSSDHPASASDESEVYISTPPAILTSSLPTTGDATGECSSPPEHSESESAIASEGSDTTSGSSTASSTPLSSPLSSPRSVLRLDYDALQGTMQEKKRLAKLKKCTKNHKSLTKRERKAAKRAQGA